MKEIVVTLHSKTSKNGNPYLQIQIGTIKRAVGSSLTISVREDEIKNLISPSIDGDILEWLTKPFQNKTETPPSEEE